MTAGRPDPAPLPATDLDELRRLAGEAVRRGADVVARAFRPFGTSGGVARKGAGDYVSEVDRESEDIIRAFLEREVPEFPVLAEEGGGRRADLFWAVDPLDGTTNFLCGLPVVGVSIALVGEGRPLVGAVCGPMLGLSFTAALGRGASSGDAPLRVSARPSSRAIVSTGFPFRDRSLLPRYLPMLEAVLEAVEDLRRPGAAALDLCWVAAGVFDGFFELNLSVWDVAAGALLVHEAGGVVTDWAGGAGYLSGDILAGSPRTHAALLAATRHCASTDR